MKKRKHLHTNFIKFILEKYSQELPDEETNVSNKKLEDEFDEIINGQEVKKDELQDEIEDDEDDENIDNLVKEYQLLEKKYKLKSNGRIYNKR
jgi:arsenate reductase-like glutaredoxin family protein